MIGRMQLAGKLAVERRTPKRAPVSWRVRNALRWGYWGGWLTVMLARLLSRVTGIPTLTSDLRVLLIRRDGTRVDYGVVGHRVITTAFVNFVVDQRFWGLQVP